MSFRGLAHCVCVDPGAQFEKVAGRRVDGLVPAELCLRREPLPGGGLHDCVHLQPGVVPVVVDLVVERARVHPQIAQHERLEQQAISVLQPL